MDSSQQQVSYPNILKSEDISQLIKHFSFAIQQRFQEIEKNCNYFTCLNSNTYEKSDVQIGILHKYNDYKTSNQHQIKLLQKFTERIVQIFQFFRGKSEEAQFLQQISQKISQKLKQIMRNQVNYHFFVNNRPKTHKSNMKPLTANNSVTNSHLSIGGPLCSKAQLDIQAVFINTKKVKTQIKESKRVVQVGKLFKYVFSILKRGYLLKLKMERADKKGKPTDKVEKNDKSDQIATISVEGTCAILRNYSIKNKQNNQNGTGNLFGRKQLSLVTSQMNYSAQKRQQYIYRKMKKRPISITQHQILSAYNPSTSILSSQKIRSLERKVSQLYSILDVERYTVLRVAKQPELWKKQQQKRNSYIQNERKRYILDYNRWKQRGTDRVGQQNQNEYQTGSPILDNQQGQELMNFVQLNNPKGDQIQSEYSFKQGPLSTQIQRQLPLQKPFQKILRQDTRFAFGLYQHTQKKSHQLEVQKGLSKRQFQIEDPQCQDSKNCSDRSRTVTFYKIKTQHQEYPSECVSAKKQLQNPNQSNSHTLVVCTSRVTSRVQQQDKILADKTSNLMDKNMREDCAYRSRSVKQSQKAFRLNLPSMLTDKSNLIVNEYKQNSNSEKKQVKLSQKSKDYLYHYHVEEHEDSSFIPMLPKRHKNNENHLLQNKLANDVSLKRKNITPNFHPLNRCRIFREKKNKKTIMMIPVNMSTRISEFDTSILNCKIKNALM